MPEAVTPATLEGSGRRIFQWPEYELDEPDIFQAVVMEHFDRHRDRGLDLEIDSGSLRLEMEDATDEAERRHTYIIDSDGDFTSLYDSPLLERKPEDEVSRHETITTSRFNALYGRARKATELADYIQEFEQYGVADQVLDRFQDAPVLAPEELDTAVKTDEVPEELYQRVGEVDLAGEDYDEALEELLEEDSTREELDTEMYTKGRDLSDYDEEFQYGEEMREIYDSMMDFVTVRFND